MTVLDAILNFRGALLALIPAFEKANLSWKRSDAYDEWDTVASALFDSLVASVLKWRLPAPLGESFRLCKYDLLLPLYGDVSTIEVASSRLPKEHRYIFHALGTGTEPLDSVEVRRVSVDGEPLGTNLEIVSLKGVSLQLRVVNPTTGKDVMKMA